MEGKKKRKQVDMLHGSLLDKILLFALPLAASSILQQLFNSVDVAVVGRFASSQAQAAVGCNGPVVNLMINLFVGISVGTNVVIANYIGQKKTDRIHDAVHTSILLALICGVIMMVLGMFIARPILELMDTPADVLEYAVLYLRIYFVGMPFIMVYNFGAAVLRSIGDTRRPLYCLVLSGIINAILNLILVIGFKMGVEGVAIPTVLSNVVSAGMVWYFLTHETGAIRLEPKKLSIKKQELVLMLQIGVPAGLQNMVFSVANVFIQASLNGFGSDAVAGSAVGINCEYYTYYMITAFNQAAVTFISQNFGAGFKDRCKKVFRLTMASSMIITALMSLAFIFGRVPFVALFTGQQAVAEFAYVRILHIMPLYILINTYEIGGSALRGVGCSMTPAILTVFGTCVLRLIWIYTVCPRYHTLDMLFNVYPISWFVTGAAVLIAYVLVWRRIDKGIRGRAAL